jgi:hypothetical protein
MLVHAAVRLSGSGTTVDAVEHSRLVVRPPAGDRAGGQRIAPTQTVAVVDVLTTRVDLNVQRGMKYSEGTNTSQPRTR